MPASTLAELRHRPFELLKELERRSRMAASGRHGADEAHEEWVGVGFRIGDDLYVTSRDEIREILTFPGVTQLPGAKPWLLGLANVRGQLLPVTDVHGFLYDEPTAIGRLTRVLVVNHDDIPAGLVVDEVRGFRRFSAQDSTDLGAAPKQSIRPYLAGAYRSGDELWGVLSLQRLVESPPFLQAAR